MKTRYRLIRRGVRSGGFYCVDTKTGKRASLQTGSKEEARQIIEAKNQAERQPFINLQIARAYLMASDPTIASRTWQAVMEEIPKTKRSETKRDGSRQFGTRRLISFETSRCLARRRSSFFASWKVARFPRMFFCEGFTTSPLI